MRALLLPLCVGALGCLSLITISSIAPELAPKQAFFFILGGGLFLATSRLPFKQLLAAKWIWYIGLCALLALTLLIGKDTRGSARWISVGGLFVIQASQLAIPIVGLLLSSILGVGANKKHISLKTILTTLFLIMVPALLILVEPDLGTTLAYLASVGVIIFFSPVSWRHIVGFTAIGFIIAVLSWSFVLKPYQKARITSFIDQSDTSGASYNAKQALIAVGSGQLWGRGLGQGVQSHLRFLPERQTDFAFASYSEEFGFLGGLVLIFLYGLLITVIVRTGLQSQFRPALLFCLSTAAMILIQTTINVGMNIGLLPITGITLPLLSYGGSSILSICTTLGIVQAIKQQHQRVASLHIN